MVKATVMLLLLLGTIATAQTDDCEEWFSDFSDSIGAPRTVGHKTVTKSNIVLRLDTYTNSHQTGDWNRFYFSIPTTAVTSTPIVLQVPSSNASLQIECFRDGQQFWANASITGSVEITWRAEGSMKARYTLNLEEHDPRIDSVFLPLQLTYIFR